MKVSSTNLRIKDAPDRSTAEDFSLDFSAIKPGIAADIKFGGSGSCPNLQWVSTKGPGPNGRTISGVTYRYGVNQLVFNAAPGTVMCDNMSYVFVFLSIATSNMVATTLAKRDKNEVQHHISILHFVGLTCGCLMLLFTRFFGSWVLTGAFQ